MESDAMTRRLVGAIANPRMDILGHCTGRLIHGKQRPESSFNHEIVFAACARFGKAVEINSRPDRLDPPRRLLDLAMEMGCDVTIDSDAHAPGQLEWLINGCERAQACEVPVSRIVNTLTAADLLGWVGKHEARGN
jgi:putative hydrolase